MDVYNITTMEEYNACVAHGIEPMRDRHFTMDIELRKKVQEQKFGRGNTEENNIRFYRYAWNIANHWCEECARPLYDYSSVYVSHILSRGAHAECAYDLRNFNILCKAHHDMWESPIKRKKMRIYKKNEKIINKLKKEYGLK